MRPIPHLSRPARLPVLLVTLTLLCAAAAVLLTHAGVQDLLRRDTERLAARVVAQGVPEQGGVSPGILGLTLADEAGRTLFHAAPAPAPHAVTATVPDGAGGWAVVTLDEADRHALAHAALRLGALGLAGVLLPGLVLLGVGAWQHRRRTGAALDGPDPLAARDPLTGLPNRQALRVQLATALAGLPAQGGMLAVLMIDLDQVRAVNDGLGQAAGDAVLRGTAERMLQMLRRDDIVARVGADEFVVVQTGLSGVAGALRLAERLSHRLAQPHRIAGREVPVSATIGIALAPRDGTDAEILMRHAEAALERAKLEARGGWRGFDPGMDAAQQARRRTAQELRAAIEAGALVLHYQSLHRLPGRDCIGREALLRWPHPERGLVSPAEFIPLAEETGLILPLGAWVLRTACREAMRWPAQQRLAVNLSPAQVRDDDILATVGAALAESGLPPDRLELEITEGLLMQDTEAVLRRLAALRALGVRIALDDFGTGYSSLGYLWRFPFDRLKIDRSFVRVLGEQPRAGAIVETIIGLGRVLRMPVTAEGVETEAQLRALAAMGCEEVQGFLLGRPAPPEPDALVPDALVPDALVPDALVPDAGAPLPAHGLTLASAAE